jgi:flavin reductase (DIM6/NTAB) family NADH-FMN oxidoreductase RutF
MPKVLFDPPYRPIYPTPAALITSISPAGAPNIITLGEVYNLSLRQPTIVGISLTKRRYSHQLISQTGEFVVNMPTVDILDKVDQCGSVSGRDVDKFATFGLTPERADLVGPPLIAECPINLECKVLGMEEIGDHDMFKGEVVAAHVDEALMDEDGRIQVDRLGAFCFMHCFNFGGYWGLGPKLADMRFTRKSTD